ncbi:glucose-1-phosphate thymidylyltransferase [Alicyclobacillus fastidiosus]|uniref:Glucose-1-phosphate thymidylyltransferase n=1 Tax=Alicyclobacillus fastidiosus TaxID=392011 RepID=A0ABY6ZNT2_9BACL|nr:glucose-1-phosphate thymidylyltransferase [Alicyclobacillus fastidiosus]WAH43821.1 glucose-1-phosphate thymidylyltransferase [Alicyclobacillus fastidiosus]GMA60052.1 glucose-1-phosphate thymidylyltransferase [Alicyclobacillus fastidiosus]
MKALLLSGGTGSRLRPLTFTGAKQLIPVANKPILFYAIESIRDAGIVDIGVVLGETGREVRSTLGDGSQWGVQISYIQQDEPRGLAHAVQLAKPFIGSDPFLMFLGDNIIKDGVRSFVNDFKNKQCNALVLLSEVSEPQRFGVAKLSKGRLVGLIEKPSNPPSNLALVGVYAFDHNIFNCVNKIQKSWRGELEITDAIQQLLDDGFYVDYRTVESWWKDIGKPEDVLDANRLVLENIPKNIIGALDDHSNVIGRVQVDSGATIVNSVIRGPAIIGQGARIENSYVGPFTSICPNVYIRNSEIENSVVLDSAVISDIETRIEDSLIGKNVSLTWSSTRPRTFRFVLGDQSQASVR